ncbi:MAG: type II toxin-antitoxin system PemK/MazF family toxin, partial [Anaerolineae bacterium]|nr:type II toxin-antitoxin system PemK/MazF family toxin [Anaerolineae bacterium]
MANRDPNIDPQIGDVWWIDFDAPNDEGDNKEDFALSSEAIGSEQKHRRPAVVIITKFTPESHSVCTVIPFTKWKQHHNDRLYLIVVEKSAINGLNLDSSALIG